MPMNHMQAIIAFANQHNIPLPGLVALIAHTFYVGTTTRIGGIIINSEENQFKMFLRADVPEGVLLDIEEKLKEALKDNGFEDLCR